MGEWRVVREGSGGVEISKGGEWGVVREGVGVGREGSGE